MNPSPLPFRVAEIEHRYGDGVHILCDPLALALLARLGSKGVVQPEAGRLVCLLYRSLVHAAVAAELPRRIVEAPTRMIDATPHGVWRGEALADDTTTVVAAVARAGLIPAQVAYDFLTEVMRPGAVRQDHLVLGREVDATGRVTGAALGAAKIGGSVDGAVLLIPDPMGATGATVGTVLRHYRQAVPGRPSQPIALHLIVTPEYLRAMTTQHPELVIYAFRLDRGLSPPHVLATIPGTHWPEERGLNDHDYVIPGAGGIGEILNNADV